ncbi:DUF3244 domain-containing protein [Parabacteroides sp. AM08-6]|uniref:DUF3244 domain-containing protein n=1 Tax=Parabacteroides sp. AM08-6 TaxID=2292053 RepID=UPI000F005DB0|nr:DUF3244 domain-containing protein [Parabacteroides sp. AM08-6]RHJ82542.1 DUF3244 domain-containing protein [Parabacteroides sp. AM08-6]
MRHFTCTLILVMCGMFCSQMIFADYVLTKGQWSTQDVRSFVPAPPKASIEGNVLTVHFINPLADLTVQITDNQTGQVIYNETISSATAANYPITLSNVENGNYTLTFTHALGYLTGIFTIE